MINLTVYSGLQKAWRSMGSAAFSKQIKTDHRLGFIVTRKEYEGRYKAMQPCSCEAEYNVTHHDNKERKIEHLRFSPRPKTLSENSESDHCDGIQNQ